MRHGDVSYVDEAGAPVKPEDVPLTPRGREQAAAARDALANVELDLVVASDLPRTLETAEIVAPGKHVELWPELAEWRGGRLDAIPPDELEAAFVGALQVKDEAQRFLGGESLGEALDRVHPALERLLARDWHTALAVLHGGVNRIVISYALSGDRTYFGTFEQAPGVHQRARRRRRRLDRPHGQLRPLRPAPPRPDDDDGAPLGAAAAVPRRARVAPRSRSRPRRRYAPRITVHFAHPLLVEPGRGECREPARGHARIHPVRDRVPEERRDVVLRLAEHRLRIDREVAARRVRGCCGGGSRRGRGRRGRASSEP